MRNRRREVATRGRVEGALEGGAVGRAAAFVMNQFQTGAG